MSRRRIFLLLASFALAALLLVALIKVSKIDIRTTTAQLQSVRLIPFLRIVLLNAILVLVSTEKWRTVDAALRRPSDSIPSHAKSFALTSAGLALGTFLPVQLAMTSARTLGTYVHGSPLKRGTMGTLFEQSFDVMATIFLGVASAATWFLRGGEAMWFGFAAAMIIVAWVIVGAMPKFLAFTTAVCASRSGTLGHWTERLTIAISQLFQSKLLMGGLPHRMLLLALVRFVVVVLMSVETAVAVGLQIGSWQMAASVPFIACASLIALTPGGLGINEMTAVGALSLFGTKVAVSAEWALANRVIIAVSYATIAIFSTVIVVTAKMLSGSILKEIQNR